MLKHKFKLLKNIFSCLPIIALITPVEAGSRVATYIQRVIVSNGAIVESKGEPAQMRATGSTGEFRFWSYDGFWSGSEYYMPKDIIFDALSSTTYDNT